MIGDIIITNVIASACLVLLIYFLDINEKEPPWTLVKIFLFSIVLTFLFGKLKTFLFSHYKWEFPLLINHFVVAGFFEEFLKFFIVMVFVWHLKSFNEETDGIIYFLLVAAGFSVLENVGYSFQFVINPYIFGMKTGQMNFYHEALQKIVLLRMFSGHIFINVVSGFFLGLAKKRHKTWLIIPGFFVSVLLHGLWNLSATQGFISYFALGFIVLDVLLFYFLIRMSFYHKFMKRLKLRINELILAARDKKYDRNIITLMEGILLNIGVLRQMEGNILNENAKKIIEALPVKIDAVPAHGKGGLTERLLIVNGILGRGRQKTGILFFVRLFFMFSISGFFVLIILIQFM